MNKKIAFVTYETPFAQCGGISAVIARLPGHMEKATGLPVTVISPFHYAILQTASLRPRLKEVCTVCTGQTKLKIWVYREWSHINALNNPFLFIKLLKNPKDSFGSFLKERFPLELCQRLESFTRIPWSDRDLIRTITGYLNLLLHGPSFYNEKRFMNITLSKQTQELLKKEKNDQLINYLLLRDAYPECIPSVRLWPWYFLEAEDRSIFAGAPHPYALDGEALAKDAMIFGEGTAKALEVIDPGAEWILLLQDWEGAATAIALEEKKYQSFLMLHNSYDSPPLEKIKGQDFKSSILSRAIPLVERPIFTVSEQFARDMTSDIFQVKIMADHLQDLLRKDFLGVDNGPFETLHIKDEIMKDSLKGVFTGLEHWKLKNKEKALEALKKITPGGDTPVWGDIVKMQRQMDSCWFVMAGRDDPRQKGYDIAAEAVRRFLTGAGEGKFFFFPIPGDEGIEGLSFLKDLAEDFPGMVAVFPFRWKEGYFSTLRAASYGLMPSLYEPFGAANEFYFNGTPGIGRATGGLLQQIVPLRAVASFSRGVQNRAALWHPQGANPTGLLYREKDKIPSASNDWKNINLTDYINGEIPGGRLGKRKNLPTYGSMVNELFLCLKDGAHIFYNKTDLYYRMIRDGIIHIQNSFSWERAAQDYGRHILN